MRSTVLPNISRAFQIGVHPTLRPISFVVTVCSSTAEVMLVEISLIWLMKVAISAIA